MAAPQIWFITGTDTGVGKTVLAVLIARLLASRPEPFRVVKPFCSGGRSDAEQLFRAQGAQFPLDQINPWHFRQPVTPSLAAQSAGIQITLEDVLRFLRSIRPVPERLVVEGAGGLLSPLGEGFGARELIVALKATPLVVCPNRLGAINQARLVFAALPPGAASRARLILMDPPRPDHVTRSNVEVLAAFLGRTRIHRLPWFSEGIWEPFDRHTKAQLERIIS